MRTQADDLKKERVRLWKILKRIEILDRTHTDRYRYFTEKYNDVVSTLNNIR